MAEESKLTKLGECERFDLWIKGMAVAGREFQLVLTDELNVIRAVLFVHDCGLDFDWINPPTKEYQVKFEKCAKKLLEETGRCP